MRFRHGSVDVLTSSVRALVSGVLCVLMVGQPMLAARGITKPGASTKQIQGQQRVLHALNRFTFGPRPGDVAAVQAMGLKPWFEQQLNPLSIDDSALEEKLSAFPAMKMQEAELKQRYPSPQMLKQIIDRNLPLPSDPVEHAIYADEIAFYKAQKAKQAMSMRWCRSRSTRSGSSPASASMPICARCSWTYPLHRKVAPASRNTATSSCQSVGWCRK